MAQHVTIQTGARLHFGLLSVSPRRGRAFGGIGLMVAAPGFDLFMRTDGSDSVTGASPHTAERILSFLAQVRLRVPELSNGVAIDVKSEIPPHGGLGSGTQLGLAIAAGLFAISDRKRPLAQELSPLVGRGARSAIGVYGFDQGGWLIEPGKRQTDSISPLLARSEFPNEWRWVLVTPSDRRGLSGEAERSAFQQLTSMPDTLSGALCRIVLTELWPAIQADDFPTVSAALWEYGQLVGSFFAPVQGGVFADPDMERLANELRRHGTHGIAQTSWGPTMAILCHSENHAREIESQVREVLAGSPYQLMTVAGRNSGATVCVEES